MKTEKLKRLLVEYLVDGKSDHSLEYLMEVSYLHGVLEYSIWADYFPNGNEIYNKLEERLEHLTK